MSTGTQFAIWCGVILLNLTYYGLLMACVGYVRGPFRTAISFFLVHAGASALLAPFLLPYRGDELFVRVIPFLPILLPGVAGCQWWFDGAPSHSPSLPQIATCFVIFGGGAFAMAGFILGLGSSFVRWARRQVEKSSTLV